MREDISLAGKIMTEFARLTGLWPVMEYPRRYLWTDAFAVCNFLELYGRTRDEKYKTLALRLVDQVHNVLGRHRRDDKRNGWISGMDEEKGNKHPTAGGLRIGKEMNERQPSEPFDEMLEWERDGQYYHYLTKWMHALSRVSVITGERKYNRWAAELAKTAHSRFAYVPAPGLRKRMYWKMSIDLARPLVSSMGQLDPLDGLITYSQLRSVAESGAERSKEMDLTDEIADMALICEGKNWLTDDPLGIGDLLCDAFKAAHMIIRTDFKPAGLPAAMLDASLQGLAYYAGTDPLEPPADYRLAFRELGLVIGLIAVEKLKELTADAPDYAGRLELNRLVDDLLRYVPLGEDIQTFWLNQANRKARSWTDHREINMVMLATSLAPDGFLGL